MRRIGVTAVAICFATSAAGAYAGAQGPRGADTLSAKAIADSQAVLRTLDEKVRANVNDPASWYHIGMIAWALADRAHAPNPPRDLDATRIYHLADSALRMAAAMAPKKAAYRVTVGKFLLVGGNPITRSAAIREFSTAVDVARATHDSAALAESAIEYGRVFWRRYDALNHRRMSTSGIDVGRSISDAMQPVARAANAMQQAAADASLGGSNDPGGALDILPQTSMKAVHDVIDNTTMALPSDVNGAGDYAHASDLFFEAYAAAPANPRTFRSVAMLLADSSRWHELESFSQTHLRTIPWDPQGWMALGLALQREGKSTPASAAFDSGMSNMMPQERARLDRLERVLRPLDTARTARGGAGDHTALERMYWLFADPLWSREGNESRIEFLARVEFAELRWTVEELNVRGADTDRGDIYIRYGPPDLVAAMAPGVNGDFTDVVTYWLYKSGLMFAFSGMSTYGSARTPQQDMKMVEGIRNAQPVRWDNIAEIKVDTIPVQVARFRGGRDSVDILVAARPNSFVIAKASDVNEPVRDWYWLLLGGTVPVYFDSSRVDTAGVRSWTRRVAPGAYVYRVEASAHSANRAARSTSQVIANNDPRTGFALRGFSISDLLIATSVDQAASGAARWSSLHPVPMAGAVPRNTQLSLVWENYDFGQRNNSAEYSVTLTIVRDRSGAGKIAARIVGLLADVAQVTVQGDRVVLKFDRAQPYAAAFADQVDLALGDTPVGFYSLTLEVTDKATGRKSTRAASFAIKEK